MKLFARLALGLVSLFSVSKSLAADPRAIFRRPMIVGASVSAGHGATSPGMRAALRYTSEGNILNTAVSGSEGVHMDWWSVDYVAKRTVVIGVDLMFWDSFLDDVGPSIAQLKQDIAIARAAHVPFIIGDIPNMGQVGFYTQSNAERMNRAIHSLCSESRGCYILPFSKIFDGMKSGHKLRYRNADYDWSGLSSDGLHLNATGSECMADMIVSIVRRM